jgi:hypothetical protein
MNEEEFYLIEDWWMDSQIELVKDSSRIWIRTQFKAAVGFWILRDGNKILDKVSQHEELPPDAIIENTAWDHEHCALWWEKISEYENDQHEGYTDGDEWLCARCYDKYIASQKNR